MRVFDTVFAGLNFLLAASAQAGGAQPGGASPNGTQLGATPPRPPTCLASSAPATFRRPLLSRPSSLLPPPPPLSTSSLTPCLPSSERGDSTCGVAVPQQSQYNSIFGFCAAVTIACDACLLAAEGLIIFCDAFYPGCAVCAPLGFPCLCIIPLAATQSVSPPNMVEASAAVESSSSRAAGAQATGAAGGGGATTVSAGRVVVAPTKSGKAPSTGGAVGNKTNGGVSPN